MNNGNHKRGRGRVFNNQRHHGRITITTTTKRTEDYDMKENNIIPPRSSSYHSKNMRACIHSFVHLSTHVVCQRPLGYYYYTDGISISFASLTLIAAA